MRKFAITAAALAMAFTVTGLASGSAEASPRLAAQNLAFSGEVEGLTEEIRHRRRRGGGVYLSLPFIGLGYGYSRPYHYDHRPYRYKRKHRRNRHYRNGNRRNWQYNGHYWGRPGYGLKGNGR